MGGEYGREFTNIMLKVSIVPKGIPPRISMHDIYVPFFAGSLLTHSSLTSTNTSPTCIYIKHQFFHKKCSQRDSGLTQICTSQLLIDYSKLNLISILEITSE